MVAAWQGLLLGCAVIGLAWMVSILVLGVFRVAPHAPAVFRDPVLLPWVALMIAAILVLGWLTASGCMTLVTSAALREREHISPGDALPDDGGSRPDGAAADQPGTVGAHQVLRAAPSGRRPVGRRPAGPPGSRGRPGRGFR